MGTITLLYTHPFFTLQNKTPGGFIVDLLKPSFTFTDLRRHPPPRCHRPAIPHPQQNQPPPPPLPQYAFST